jgi:uncharacterized protein (TIGR03437 family)
MIRRQFSTILATVLFAATALGVNAGQDDTSARRVPRPKRQSARPASKSVNTERRQAAERKPAPTRLDRYALILSDPPLARRVTSRRQLLAVAAGPARQQIAARQATLKLALNARNIHVISSSQILLNAVYVTAPGVDMSTLRSLPGVARVVRMLPIHRALNVALGLENVPAAWNALGGQQNAGKGIRIGIIDTGIDVLHPAFQDSSLQPPANYPPSSGVNEDNWPGYTNGKIIVARSYVPELVDFGHPDTSRPDDLSPEDHVGHGTAAAMIAAGETVNAPLATITGVAPKAYLGNYKIFGSPGVNDITFPDVLFNALEDAITDGMDVVSVSLAMPAIWSPDDSGAVCGADSGIACDQMAAVVENAANMGLTVVTAAGNQADTGYQFPSYGTIDSPGTAPSAITVGASYNGHIFYASVKVPGSDAPSNLRQINTFFGDAPKPGGAYSAPLVDVSVVGGANNAEACYSLDPNSLAGSIALVQRSAYCHFDLQAINIENAGAAGIIFYQFDGNDSIFSIEGVTEIGIPVTLISNTDGVSLQTFLTSHPKHQVTLDPAIAEFNAGADYVAYFSSRGPATGTGGIKPELVAVGTDIYTATQSYDPNGALFDPSGYTVVQGTSFAVPMVAGAAALVKQANPGFTPGQIKSAVVNTANDQVNDIDADGNSVLAGIGAAGAGKLDAGAAVQSQVTIEPATLSFGQISGSLPSMNLTISNFSNRTQRLNLSLDPFFTDPNASVVFSSNSVTLNPNTAATVQVSLQGNLPGPGIYEGFVWVISSDNSVNLHAPYLYFVGDGNPVDAYPLRGRDFAEAAGNPVNGDLLLKVVDQYGAPVPNYPVKVSNSFGDGTVTGGDGQTDSLGISFATATVGGPGYQSFTADIGNPAIFSIFFDGRAFEPPTVDPSGVVNGASFVKNQQGFAPGSYLSLFGTGLSEVTRLFYTPYLPLSLANVSVSFDVPSDNVSVPASVVYVSPGQLNIQIPWELAGYTSAQMKVSIGLTSSAVMTVPINTYSPGFFEYLTGGQSYLAAQDASYRMIGPSNPAQGGSIILLYSNGLGPVTTPIPSGQPTPNQQITTTVTPQVTIGGKPAQVVFSGLSPQSIGLYQVNVKVPTGLSPGNQTVKMSINGVDAKDAVIPVK